MRKLLSLGVIVSTAVALIAPVLQASPAHAASTNTTVVLSFDDGVASQSIAQSLLAAHGMEGTFYVNSDYIGTTGFLSWNQLTAFQAAGDEIGGHTLDHLDLTQQTQDVATAQVCQDRVNLMSHGLQVTDFAYPYGDGYDTASVRQIVQDCGYNSARRAWGLYSSDPACFVGTTPTGCGYPYADSIPPADIWGVRTADNPQDTWTLAQIEQEVTQAEQNGGGLVPLVFHEICDGCDQYSVTQQTLQSFLDWLQPRAALGTVTQTMYQVVGGPVQPADTLPPTTTITCGGVACTSGYYNPSTLIALSSTDGTGSGVASIHYSTDGTDPSPTSPTYTTPFTLPATATVKYRAYDNAGNVEAVKSETVNIDSTAPTSTIECNGAACSTNGYASAVSVSLAGNDTGGSGLAAVRYTTDGSDPTPSSSVYSSPITVSSTETIEYRAFDNAGNAGAVNSQVVLIDSSAPASSIACNGVACAGGWYGGSVQVSLTANDGSGSGVAAIRYTTDGSDPTAASALYSAPFALTSMTTVKFRSWDNTGNMEPTHTQLIQIDHVAPASSISCKGTACSTGWYRGPVQVSLAATDDGGSGVGALHYTTDGSTPTLASPAYSAPFTVSATTTVKFRAFDNAGNEEAVRTQVVKIDKTGPTLSLASPKPRARVTGDLRIAPRVTDAQSGVAKVVFYIDGHLALTDTTPSYAFVWHTAKSAKRAHTITIRAYDRAGNSVSKSFTFIVQ